jgi:hypothetical protein
VQRYGGSRSARASAILAATRSLPKSCSALSRLWAAQKIRQFSAVDAHGFPAPMLELGPTIAADRVKRNRLRRAFSRARAGVERQWLVHEFNFAQAK